MHHRSPLEPCDIHSGTRRLYLRRCRISCPESPSTFAIRLISAHCSTLSKCLPPVSIARSSQGLGPAGWLRPCARWTSFRPAQVDQYSGGAYTNPTPAIEEALQTQGFCFRSSGRTEAAGTNSGTDFRPESIVPVLRGHSPGTK